MRSISMWRAAHAVLAVLVVAVLASMVALRADPPAGPPQPASAAVGAEVVAAEAVPCEVPGSRGCERLTLRLTGGAEAGRTIRTTTGEAVSDADVDVGDAVRVVRNEVPAGAAGVEPFTITDFERRAPLGWLALLFVVVALAVGRVRGLRALVGLAASVAIVFGFVVPAILAGRPAPAVALSGALAIMLVTVLVTHGPGVKSVAAILGTTLSLLLTVALGAAFVQLAHLTGLSSDASSVLLAGRDDLSAEGIVLAGLVIGALGVLDDVTVSQAATVLALRRANAALGRRELFRRALSVGQDHASATVNTLVLAYVGAALPALLILGGGGTGIGDALNSEPVAQEVVAMLAGSVGLLAAVPLTTWLTALLAQHVPADRLGDEHAHVH